MKRHHAMPFGAEMNGRSTRFRLWAPAAQEVELELSLEQLRMSISMQSVGAGWHEAVVTEVPAGARYLYRLDGGIAVPDPASRYNPEDVHAASAVVDPAAFDWPDADWRGRPWHEAVIYELHLGSFTSEGTAAAAIERLDELVALGVTALELMPVADFPGQRNWGYDGVLPFAPDASYGRPEDLKRLVAAAHARGLMVLLDVVYNHFGPEGNYLNRYAPDFFDPTRQTPWGAAINFDGENARTVRDFFVHNALYWLEEYHFDGLRLDAVHAIVDESRPDIVAELAAAVRAGPGQQRHVHLVLENDANEAARIGHRGVGASALADAQWNDDLHHALHVLVTGEKDGYYDDYADQPLWLLGRALAEGYAYQGEPSRYRGGARRGSPCAFLPPTAFVGFLQSHDQVGNRALGTRIATLAHTPALRLAVACALLAPSIPMLFMGEEFAASSPFLFFCDFGPELAEQVRDGRRREFARFERFREPAARAAIPDPNDAATFEASKLLWAEREQPGHAEWLALYRELLALRARHIVPQLAALKAPGRFACYASTGLAVDWPLSGTAVLQLRANFSAVPVADVPPVAGEVIYTSDPAATPSWLPAWSGLWALGEAR